MDGGVEEIGWGKAVSVACGCGCGCGCGFKDDLLCGNADYLVSLFQINTWIPSLTILRKTAPHHRKLLTSTCYLSFACITQTTLYLILTSQIIPNFSNFWTASSTSKLQQLSSNFPLINSSHCLSRSYSSITKLQTNKKLTYLQNLP